jgi:hypothetical protein
MLPRHQKTICRPLVKIVRHESQLDERLDSHAKEIVVERVMYCQL